MRARRQEGRPRPSGVHSAFAGKAVGRTGGVCIYGADHSGLEPRVNTQRRQASSSTWAAPGRGGAPSRSRGGQHVLTMEHASAVLALRLCACPTSLRVPEHAALSSLLPETTKVIVSAAGAAAASQGVFPARMSTAGPHKARVHPSGSQPHSPNTTPPRAGWVDHSVF